MILSGNKTKWATEDLRAFLEEAVRQFGFDETRKTEVTVSVVRAKYRMGAAYEPLYRRIRLRIPNTGLTSIPRADLQRLAQLMWWGLGVIRRFPKADLRRWASQPVQWVEISGLQIRRQDVLHPPPSKAEKMDALKAKRAERAKKQVTMLEKRVAHPAKSLDRAKKALTKANRRVRYYEKQEPNQTLADRIKAKLAGQLPADPKP